MELIINPINDTLSELERHDEEAFSRFNLMVPEIRIARPSSDSPPYLVDVLCVVERPIVTPQEYEAFNTVRESIRERITSPEVRIGDFELVSDDELSVAEYFSTAPIYLDDFTYRGEETVGTEPHRP